ncbi:MAG TPA: hypothetical protein VG055_15270, partial [Planctomycetaceae bacterium]|nr:hypothetical protein [Planctomycetaceae bacterium]
MLTVVFHPRFGAGTLFNQGPYTTLNSPDVHVVFWGPYWTSQPLRIRPQEIDFRPFFNEAKAIVQSPFFKGLTEYGSDGKIGKIDYTVDNTVVTTGFDSANLSGTSGQVAFNELARLINANQLVAPGTTANLSVAPIYVIVTDPTESDGNGGYNTWGWINGKTHLANVISIGTDVNHFGFGDTFSHEMAERISDPTDPGDSAASNLTPNGVRVTPNPYTPNNLLNNPSAVYSAVSNRNQISDGEPEPNNQDHYSYLLGGDPLKEVQPFWSAQTGAYIVPDGNQETFDLNPIWGVEVIPNPPNPPTTNATFTNFYDLTINGDQLAGKDDNIVISSDSAGGLEVNLNGQIAYFDPSTKNTAGTPLSSITVNGLTGNNTLTVDFRNGDPIPGGGMTFNGGSGTNTIRTLGDGAFFLSNGSLRYGFVNTKSITLNNVQVANLTGMTGNDYFAVNGWTGTGSINGGGGKSGLFAAKDADFTINSSELQTSDGMDLLLSNLSAATLAGGPNAHTFTDNGWNPSLNMSGGSGNDTFNVNYSPNPGAVTIGDGIAGNNAVYTNDLASTDLPGSVTYSATTTGTTGTLTRSGTIIVGNLFRRRFVHESASVSYSNIATVFVNADDKGNNFSVLAIPRGTEVVYDAGKGGDAVTVGNAGTWLGIIGGGLAVNGQGNTTLEL